MKLEDLVPDLYVKSIFDIDLHALKDKGVTTIISDLDNTLVEADSPEHTPEILKWFSDLDELGFKIILLSNNSKIRVADFAKQISVPYIHRAMKPFGHSYRKALKIMSSSAKETIVIGDQMLTDIFGGKRMKMFTIMVAPISIKEAKSTQINRGIERIILPLLKKRGFYLWED